MSSLDKASIEKAIDAVVDPHTDASITRNNTIEGLDIDGDQVSIKLSLGYPAQSAHAELAGLVENAEDIAYRMQWDMEEEPVIRQFTLFEDLDEKERAVVSVIREDQVAAIDRIARQTGIESQALAGLLLNLEFKGVIRTLPGHRYAMRR